MAHGLESRVPFLDHPLIEFAATIPADVKFRDGNMKHMLKTSFAKELPSSLINRRDKMGFPVPLKEWFAGELRDFSRSIFQSMIANDRPFVNNEGIADMLTSGEFSRKTWGLLSLELWYQAFHDKADKFRAMIE